LKMEPTEGSETSAFENWTPGRYPKEANLHSRHGESLRTKKNMIILTRIITIPLLMSLMITAIQINLRYFIKTYGDLPTK